MSDEIKSNINVATESSKGISGASEQLGEFADVAIANTNDPTNTECESAYSSMKDMLSSYMTVAKRDADRISAVGIYFEELDAFLAADMQNEAKQ